MTPRNHLPLFVLCFSILLLPLFSATISITAPNDGVTVTSSNVDIGFTYTPDTNPGPRDWSCQLGGSLGVAAADSCGPSCTISAYSIPVSGSASAIHLSNIPSGTYSWFLDCLGPAVSPTLSPVRSIIIAPTTPTTASIDLMGAAATDVLPAIGTSQSSFPIHFTYHAGDSAITTSSCIALVDDVTVGTITATSDVPATITADFSKVDQTHDHALQIRCDATHPNFPIYSFRKNLIYQTAATTGPHISLLYPANGQAVTSGDTFSFHYNSGATKSDADCRVYIDDYLSLTPMSFSVPADTDYQLKLDSKSALLPFSPGPHRWTAVCTDVASVGQPTVQFQATAPDALFTVVTSDQTACNVHDNTVTTTIQLPGTTTCNVHDNSVTATLTPPSGTCNVHDNSITTTITPPSGTCNVHDNSVTVTLSPPPATCNVHDNSVTLNIASPGQPPVMWTGKIGEIHTLADGTVISIGAIYFSASTCTNLIPCSVSGQQAQVVIAPPGITPYTWSANPGDMTTLPDNTVLTATKFDQTIDPCSAGSPSDWVAKRGDIKTLPDGTELDIGALYYTASTCDSLNPTCAISAQQAQVVIALPGITPSTWSANPGDTKTLSNGYKLTIKKFDQTVDACSSTPPSDWVAKRGDIKTLPDGTELDIGALYYTASTCDSLNPTCAISAQQAQMVIALPGITPSTWSANPGDTKTLPDGYKLTIKSFAQTVDACSSGAPSDWVAKRGDIKTLPDGTELDIGALYYTASTCTSQNPTCAISAQQAQVVIALPGITPSTWSANPGDTKTLPDGYTITIKSFDQTVDACGSGSGSDWVAKKGDTKTLPDGTVLDIGAFYFTTAPCTSTQPICVVSDQSVAMNIVPSGGNPFSWPAKLGDAQTLPDGVILTIKGYAQTVDACTLSTNPANPSTPNNPPGNPGSTGGSTGGSGSSGGSGSTGSGTGGGQVFHPVGSANNPSGTAPPATTADPHVSLAAPSNVPLGSLVNLQLTDFAGTPVAGIQILVNAPGSRTLQPPPTDASGQTSFQPTDSGHYTYSVVGRVLSNQPATDVAPTPVAAAQNAPAAANAPSAVNAQTTSTTTTPFPWDIVAGVVLVIAIIVAVRFAWPKPAPKV